MFEWDDKETAMMKLRFIFSEITKVTLLSWMIMFQICINQSAELSQPKITFRRWYFKVIDRLKDNTCNVDKMILEMIRKRSVDWWVSLAWIARKPLTDLWFWEFSNLAAWILDL